MLLTAITSSGIVTNSLPEKIEGKYLIYSDYYCSKEPLISVEGIEGQWTAASTRRVKILDDKGNIVKNQILYPGFIYLLLKDGKERIAIFTEPATEDRQLFHKYIIADGTELSIGRDRQNDINYDYSFVSAFHAMLSLNNGKWFIRDNNSTNGSYVCSNRVSEAELSIGSIINIMGLKIIIGSDFIALNNPDGKVTLTEKLHPFSKQSRIVCDEEEDYELPEENFFFRSPRFKQDVETKKIKIDSPPTSPIAEEMPWPLVMGSSFAMGAMSIVTIVSAVATNNVSSMVMGGSMLVATLLLPTITRIYERKRRHQKERKRQEKYREYLSQISKEITEACRQQENILNSNFIEISDCEKRISEVKRTLWERSPGQNDFLRVRVGHGNGKLDADITYQEKQFTLDDDNLRDELYNLCEKPKILHNIPITISLYDDYVSGVIGERKQVVEFARGMIILLSSLYSYDEVKFVFLYDKSENDSFEFVKWLPHVWSSDNKFRYIATNNDESKEVSAAMENIISTRLELNDSYLKNALPYYIVFSLSKKLSIHSDLIKQILSKKNNINISIVSFCDEIKDLPKETTKIIELSSILGRIFDKNDIASNSVDFTPDIFLTKDPLDLSTCLANIILDDTNAGFVLPKKISFLELYGVGKVDHLNSLTRWNDNNPVKSLEAAVGIDSYGDILKVDLHEKFHGPHGLIAGMTGSGKSEFIITFILSLAVNYHPHEVAFILIDYKGGGMAKAFENLPHTAGIITNLDGPSIKRSLVSIESELKRRQSIFSETCKKIGISTIDIYKYQNLFREGAVVTPLPHLFIIADEFAELKTQQPEFMEQLVSAARIGRSLGVHLILATQKPSGVVDAQIWSNSRFKICLKVQEKADSVDMLKRPDAAELSDTGRFYFQVGYNELFELGQSAWAGAIYLPSDRIQKEKDDSVVVIDINGHPIREVKQKHISAFISSTKTQLDAITEYLIGIASKENVKADYLWIEPIPPFIILDTIRTKYNVKPSRFILNPVIGEYDDPAHQKQHVLCLPLSKEGNAVVYGNAGTGKTTFINAIVYSLLCEHTPDEVYIYILDFASETLRSFSYAPHIGDVIVSSEEEKTNNLFRMLRAEVEKRKKLFASFSGDYSSYIRFSGASLHSIVVIINNYASFIETYEDKEEDLQYLSREGSKYGIYFILTATAPNSIRLRILQNFNQIFALQLNDDSDYSAVVGRTNGLIPEKYKGRGLVKLDDIYEFQIAHIGTEDNLNDYIVRFCKQLSDNWNGNRAERVPILPEVVNIDFLRDYLTNNNKLLVPVGVESISFKVHMYPFGLRAVNVVMSESNGYESFFGELIKISGLDKKQNTIVFDVSKSFILDNPNIKVVSSIKECDVEAQNLNDLFKNRELMIGSEDEKSGSIENVVVFINSVADFFIQISESAESCLNYILERVKPEHRIIFIFADQAKAFKSLWSYNWYKKQISTFDGIWVGDGISRQYVMTPGKTTPEMRESLSDEFGFSLINNRAVKVKLLTGKDVD